MRTKMYPSFQKFLPVINTKRTHVGPAIPVAPVAIKDRYNPKVLRMDHRSTEIKVSPIS
jgi:hypothetical protein